MKRHPVPGCTCGDGDESQGINDMKATQQTAFRDLTRTKRLLTLSLVVSVGAFAPTSFVAKASEQSAEDGPNQAPVETAGDYRLAPGDILTVVVLDQPQLSGKFVIDGGGSALLPLAGSVSLKGLTLVEAQQAIQQRFADGVLVQPGVSVRLAEFRPIFVTGGVRKPGSYRFVLGESAKAAIATAGGEGPAIEQPLSVATSDYITATQHLNQLEADRATLVVRKARLEAQRDGREDFVMPVAVGFSVRNADLDRAYAFENDTFLKLADTYRHQMQTLDEQRPRVQAELDAVTIQIAKQKERLGIVESHLTDLQTLFDKGLLRKDVLLNQQIEKTLVESQLSNLQAQVAHLRQVMGDLDIRAEDLKASFEKQTLTELQETNQRLSEIENSVGPARKILQVKAEAATADTDDADYTVFISRPQDGRVVTFRASDDTMLSPGDIVEVKMKTKPADSDDGSSPSTQAARELDMLSPVAEGSDSVTR